MEANPIPYGRQHIRQDDIEAVQKALEHPFLTTGPMTEEFEKDLCRLTGARHAIVCANGTAALHLACMALGITGRDLGLTSPNSFLASANCIEFCGGKADFIDIDSQTLCMDPGLLEAFCKSQGPPKVVIPVDFAGLAADLPAIHGLAREFGFSVIEDAAHAVGSTYTHQGSEFICGACTHSDMAIFSFHPVKTITTGEGGAVTTNDDDLARKLRTLRSHGMVRSSDLARDTDGPWYYEMDELGYNYRLTDIQCALGIAQIRKIREFKARRNDIVRQYNAAFEGDDRLILPPRGLAGPACPHIYPIRFAGGSRVRKRMYQALAEQQIFCQIHYIPIYWQPYYAKKYGYPKGKCPNAETYYGQTLSLPLFPALTNAQVRHVIQTLLSLL